MSPNISLFKTQFFVVPGMQSNSRPGMLCLLICICSRFLLVEANPHNFTDEGIGQGDAPNSSVCRKALAQVHSRPEKCNISRIVIGCHFDSGFFSYLEFQYCFFDSSIVPTIIMVLWLLTLLGAFAVIADSFFSPSLIALARSMHMSQNLAGVTLLAFGNGAPDVFSAITAITTGDPEAPDEGLGLGFLMGSGLLVSTVTAGLIMIIHPFRTTRRPFLKDTVFYMIAISWSAVILIRRKIYLGDSVGYICLYLVYVLVTWISGRVHRRTPKNGVYIKCSRCFHDVYSYICSGFRHLVNTCPLNKPMEVQDLSELEKQSCWKRFSKFMFAAPKADVTPGAEKNKKCVIEVDLYNTDLLRTDMPSTNQFRVDGNGRVYKNNEIKMIAFKSKTKVDFPKSTSTPACPKIEITGAAEEHNLEPIAYSPRQIIDRLDPKQIPTFNTSLSDHSLTGSTLTTHRKHSPTSGSRRNSQNLSSQAATFARRRSAVGGIGLRSRTPSINVKRGSQRISAMEQLPFVVRWIIANKEAEEQELFEASNLTLDKQAQYSVESGNAMNALTDGRCRCLSESPRRVQKSIEYGHGNRRIYDRSRSVSFADDQSGVYPENFSKLPRVSSTSFLEIRSNNLRAGDKLPVLLGPKPCTLTLSTETQFEADELEDDAEFQTNAYIEWASWGMWHHLIYTICPINIVEWSNMSIFVKVLEIIQAPIFLLFRLTIPVVYEDLEPTPITDDMEVEVDQFPDSQSIGHLVERRMPNSNATIYSQNRSVSNQITTDSSTAVEFNSVADNASARTIDKKIDLEDMHGWCRPLNSFQCIMTPVIWVMLITVGGHPAGLAMLPNSRFPVVGIICIISSITGIAIFFSTKWDRAPMPFHRPFFALVGFFSSIIWIYAISHELVNSLEALGIVWEISEAILGITVMAFASSISDLLSNLLLARNGYPRIAYAACIGSPLFNILIGAGVSYTIKTVRSLDHNADLSFTLTHAVLFTFLLIVLSTNVIVAVTCHFKLGRIHGFVLLFVYVIFLILGVLIEADIIVSPAPWNLLTGTE